MLNPQRFAFLIAIGFFLNITFSCKQIDKSKPIQNNQEVHLAQVADTSIEASDTFPEIDRVDFDVTEWSELSESHGMILDLKYASKDNFTNQVIYPCGRCFLRPNFAVRILQAQKLLNDSLEYKFKLFDCYRPRPAQQRLWDIYPDLNYVSPPTKGSMHNRGLAVDLTIVDKTGKELDMGTAFDFFGPESHSAFADLPKEVLENRNLLRSMMNRVGLTGIRTEWWHFSLKPVKHELSDWEWPCP